MHYTTSCNTQSSDPEDGQSNCPKHVEVNGIINKLLLLHLVGCLYYLLEFIFSYIFGSFTRGRLINICMLYLLNLFLNISCLSPADGRSLLPKHFFFFLHML